MLTRRLSCGVVGVLLVLGIATAGRSESDKAAASR